MSQLNQRLRVVEYIEKTGKATIDAVRDLWHELTFTDAEAAYYQQKGYAAEINPLTTSNQRLESARQLVVNGSPAEGSPSVKVKVVLQPHKSQSASVTVSVAVRILKETMYDVGGNKKRSVYDFEVANCDYQIERTEASIRGHERHLAVFQYIRKQLVINGVSEVNKLSDGEQSVIAHIVDRADKGQDPFGDGPTGPPRFGPVSEGGGGAPAELGVA